MLTSATRRANAELEFAIKLRKWRASLCDTAPPAATCSPNRAPARDRASADHEPIYFWTEVDRNPRLFAECGHPQGRDMAPTSPEPFRFAAGRRLR
jgi:hypothetical protein